MDSGNSASIQSSSGGEDHEFDSFVGDHQPISSFLNPSSHDHFSSITGPPARPPQFLAHDQIPTFFDLSHHNPDHQYNNDNDLIWSRGSRSQQEASYANFENLTVPSSSLPSRITQSTAQGQLITDPSSSMSSLSQTSSVSNVATKNPKKRTRASRRAPTTVLTTDTTNFRQMVQEFTGIPAGPFPGSPYNSRSLDLFSALRPGPGPGHMNALSPLYPLIRPASGHKVNISTSTSNIPDITNYSSDHDNLLNLQQHSLINHPLQPSLQLGANVSRSNDGVQENLVPFDHGNIHTSSDSHYMSGYNLNLDEQGMENASTTKSQGVWIRPSDH